MSWVVSLESLSQPVPPGKLPVPASATRACWVLTLLPGRQGAIANLCCAMPLRGPQINLLAGTGAAQSCCQPPHPTPAPCPRFWPFPRPLRRRGSHNHIKCPAHSECRLLGLLLLPHGWGTAPAPRTSASLGHRWGPWSQASRSSWGTFFPRGVTERQRGFTPASSYRSTNLLLPYSVTSIFSLHSKGTAELSGVGCP